jgi:hypothetical protein
MKIKRAVPKIIKSSNVEFKQVEKFISDMLDNFYSELQLYYIIHKDASIFEYIEQVYLNFLVNGIVRHDTGNRYSAIQEYPVYEENKMPKGRALSNKRKNAYSYGRADLYIEDNNYGYLFEAKHDYGTVKRDLKYFNKEAKTLLISELESVIGQGKDYYNVEKKYYKKPTYIIAIIFESLYYKNYKECENYLNELKKYNSEMENMKNYFETFYYIDGTIQNKIYYKSLSVYGMIIKSEEVNEKIP